MKKQQNVLEIPQHIHRHVYFLDRNAKKRHVKYWSKAAYMGKKIQGHSLRKLFVLYFENPVCRRRKRRLSQWSRIRRFPETILFSSIAPAGMSIRSPWFAIMMTVPWISKITHLNILDNKFLNFLNIKGYNCLTNI